MKKFFIRLLVFVLIFALCFAGLQGILHYRWAGNEDLYTRNVLYAQASPDSIDVLCIGTSEMYALFDPIVTYEEAGITGYNFAITFRCAMTAYYQLLYALEYQTPSVVICDFSSLFSDMLPKNQESIYRKVVECMPDKDLKEQMIREICAVDDTQSYLSWKLPLLRYHSLWSELKQENFQPDHQVNDAYPAFKKGAMLYNDHYKMEPLEITPELWDAPAISESFSEFSVGYYDKIIELCRHKGIEIFAVTPPKIQDAAYYATNEDLFRAYFESREVPWLNYCTYDQVQRLGLNFQDHYYDRSHLNISGSIVLSKALAHDLVDMLDLESHRGDPAYTAEWEDLLPQFHQWLAEIGVSETK